MGNVIKLNNVYEQEITNLKERIAYYERLVPEVLINNIEQLKKEVVEKTADVIRLSEENGKLKERVEQMNVNYTKAVEVGILKENNNYKAKYERLQKDYNSLYSGKVAGPDGRVRAAQEREQQAYNREKTALTELNVAKLTIEEKESIIKELNQTLGNTKELLVKAETSLDYSRQQIEMLNEQKEMLEKIINSLAVNSEKIDSIKVVGSEVASGGGRNLFKSEEDTLEKFEMMLKLARLPVEQRGNRLMKVGKADLAREYKCDKVQDFDNKIRTMVGLGYLEIIELYVNNEEDIDKLRINIDKKKYYNINVEEVISLLGKLKERNI